MFTKIIGAQVLQDVSQFVAALETMFGGFRQRAEETYRLLAAPGTAFVVVAAPEPAALREASYFVDRLATDNMPLAGLVLNRVTRSAAPELPAERALAAAEELDSVATPIRCAASVLRVHAERVATATRQRGSRSASPGPTRRCRRPRSRRWPATSTTWRACGRRRRNWRGGARPKPAGGGCVRRRSRPERLGARRSRAALAMR